MKVDSHVTFTTRGGYMYILLWLPNDNDADDDDDDDLFPPGTPLMDLEGRERE